MELETYFEEVIDELVSRGLDTLEAIDVVSDWGGQGFIEAGFDKHQDVEDLVDELLNKYNN